MLKMLKVFMTIIKLNLPIIGIRSLTVFSRFGFVSKYIMRFLMSLLYVEVTISMEVCKFSLWIAKNELHANAKGKKIII